MELIHTILDTFGFPLLMAATIALFILETKFELRKRVQPRLKRIITNVGFAIPSIILLRLALIPAMVFVALKNQEWQIGINYLYRLPAAVEFVLGFLMLDYLIYFWHWLMHKIPLLWRFHLVHHTDLDLDVTTAVRFHVGELAASIIGRGAFVIIVGASPLLVVVYEIFFEAATDFHHSNLRLPEKVERALNLFIVTPRMHGIHHSVINRERDSNFSTIFSFWDRLHRTLKLHIRQEALTIGIPTHRNPAELSIIRLLLMPFRKQPKPKGEE